MILPPDCRQYADPFWLTPEQRRELILLIAEQGEAGIDEFIRRHGRDDSTIARRIQRVRAQLLEEGAELRRRLRSQYDEARHKATQRLEAALGRLRREEEELRRRRSDMTGRLPGDIEQHLRSLPMVELALAPAKSVPFHLRLWNAVRRFFAWIWRGLLWLVGRRRRVTGKAKAIAFGVPGLGGPMVSVELDLEAALRQDPRLRKRIRQRMGNTWAVRARRMWRILLGAEDYAEVARAIMEEEMKQAAEKRSSELRKELDSVASQLRSREGKEDEERKEAEALLARLDEAERLEQERLKDTLAARPAEDVRDLIVGELEAGGFVERLTEGTRVTGRFLENLAALVYAEEAKGLGATSESAIGSTIEGEGILERTPLVSHDETSHMDTAASLLQARTRHPHVKHLLEEDVLVYRERRSSLTHVVLVLDKSLSMEENDRLAAGKRALLALYWGVKRRSPQNTVDVLLMDTSVVRADLGQAWDAKPGGFTNTGRAIEAARALLQYSRASRKLLFLVTDGLPEALTIEGRDVAGRPEEAMAYAVRQAERLNDVKGLATTIVLLEPKNPLFVKAGEKLAAKCRGKLIKANPSDLSRNLLVELRSQALEAPVAA